MTPLKFCVPQMNVCALCLFALSFLVALPLQDASAQTKKLRIAVVDFEDKTNQTFYYGGRSKHPGEGVADMLTTASIGLPISRGQPPCNRHRRHVARSPNLDNLRSAKARNASD